MTRAEMIAQPEDALDELSGPAWEDVYYPRSLLSRASEQIEAVIDALKSQQQEGGQS